MQVNLVFVAGLCRFCLIGSHSNRVRTPTPVSFLGFSRFARRFMKAIRFYRLLLELADIRGVLRHPQRNSPPSLSSYTSTYSFFQSSPSAISEFSVRQHCSRSQLMTSFQRWLIFMDSFHLSLDHRQPSFIDPRVTLRKFTFVHLRVIQYFSFGSPNNVDKSLMVARIVRKTKEAIMSILRNEKSPLSFIDPNSIWSESTFVHWCVYSCCRNIFFH